MYLFYTFLCALGFSLIHFLSKYMKFAGKIPRSRFLSLAAGVAVSYVFVHLLPELNEYQDIVSKRLNNGIFQYIENHTYIIALFGLVLFYSLERLVKLSNESHSLKDPDKPRSGIFWIHIASFFIYNAVIGYLLVHQLFNRTYGLLFYFLALGVHFITNDWSLRKDHKQIYDTYGRLLLSFAILFGWGVGTLTEISDFGISILQAFIAGGVILNVMKEELPSEQKSSISSFLAGVIGYTALLLLV